MFVVRENNSGIHEITNQRDVEEEAFKYYRDLFDYRETDGKEISEFLGPELSESCPKLSDLQKQKMEGLITEEELTKYLKKVKKKKGPGVAFL